MLAAFLADSKLLPEKRLRVRGSQVVASSVQLESMRFPSKAELLLSCCLIYYTACSSRVAVQALPVVVNTWAFKSANKKAWDTLQAGGSSVDAVEQVGQRLA